MENAITLAVNGEPITVKVQRKKIKRLTLRLDKTGAPVLSLPQRCSMAQAKQFLQSCQGWLAKNVHPRSFFTLPETLKEGDRVLLLGQWHTLHLQSASTPQLTRTPQGVTLSCRAPQDAQKAAAAYEKALRKLAEELFSQALAHWHPIIAHRIPARPKLSVKKMTSRWGSASVQKNHINMSLYLLKAPPACISYVALHETAHFLHFDHSAAFYAVLAEHMPDYKQRKAQLKALSNS